MPQVMCAFDEMIPIEKIVPNPRNPNQHPVRQIEMLAKIIKAQGWRVPITVSTKSGFVVRGHGRFEAAKKLACAVVPVDFQDYANEAEEWADLIADNRIAELAEVDDTLLADLLKEIREQDIDIELTGFDLSEIDEIIAASNQEAGLTDPDDVPPLPEKPVTIPGDIWLIGEHRLLCGDSTKADDVGRLMDGKKAYLMNTDPPYGVDYSKTKDGIPRIGFKNHNEKWGDIQNDCMDGPSLQSFLESVFTTILPHLQNAAWYLWHAHLTQGFFAAAAAAAAANVVLHRQIIWKKPGFVLTRSGMYHWSHEPCFYGWVKGQRPAWYGDKSQKSVWEIGRDKDHGKNHPTQKPVELFSIPILNHCKLGEICIDPFAGSGSQFIAAEQLGRKCYGIEIEPRYCDVIVKRWQDFTGNKAALDGDGRTFDELNAERCGN